MKKPAPKRVLLDSSFLIAALEEGRPYAVEALKDAINRLNAGTLKLAMAATIEAEMRVKNPSFARPKKVEFIAFGIAAADKLATLLPRAHTREPGQRKGYWKFDAITLACGLAAGVEAIVSEDEDFEKMIATCNLPIASLASEELHMEEIGTRVASQRRAAEREAREAEKRAKAESARRTAVHKATPTEVPKAAAPAKRGAKPKATN